MVIIISLSFSSKGGSTVSLKEGVYDVQNVDTPIAVAQGGTVNIGVDGNKGNFTGKDLSLVGDVIVKSDPNHASESILVLMVNCHYGTV